MPSLSVQSVNPPIEVIAAGGSKMLCRENVQVEFKIVTDAGPLDLKNIECLVLKAHEEEVLLRRMTLLGLFLMAFLSSSRSRILMLQRPKPHSR